MTIGIGIGKLALANRGKQGKEEINENEMIYSQ